MSLKMLSLIVIFLLYENVYSMMDRTEKQYIGLVTNNYIDLKQASPFCKANKEMWATYCDLALHKIRRNINGTKYRYMYSDYQSFRREKASQKCEWKTVTYKPSQEIQGTFTQPMANCKIRPAVLSEHYSFESTFPSKIWIYENNTWVIVFEEISSVIKIVALIETEEPIEISVSPNLFKFNPPKRINNKEEVHKAANSLRTGYQLNSIKNILNSKFPLRLLQICIMLLDAKPNSEIHTEREPYYTDDEIPLKTLALIHVLNVRKDAKKEYRESFSIEVHQCHTKDDNTKYAIAEGQQYSVILLEKVQTARALTYMPTELIKNVRPEFIEIIDTLQ